MEVAISAVAIALIAATMAGVIVLTAMRRR
jgi:hypothetical protein